METNPLSSDEVDVEILIQVKDNTLQVFGFEAISLEETYVILAAALEGLQKILEKDVEVASIH